MHPQSPLWGTDYPLELVHVLHPWHSQVGKIWPLQEVIDDPDFLGICDGETLAWVDCDGIAKSPVLAPHEITRLPGLHEAFPPEATRKRLSYLTVLGLIWLQTDGLFEGFQKGVFGSVVYFDLFVIVGKLAVPVVWHFSGDWGRLSLVATADDLDAPTLQPVEEGFQNGAGHCADLVPDDHTGNEFLSHPFWRPFCLATPAEEAMIGLGLNAPGPHLFGQAMGRGEDEGISGTEELDRSRGFAAAPAAV